MKKLAILLCSICSLAVLSNAQEAATNTILKIRAAEARQHLNAAVVVSGKIVEVNKAERIVRLNFEKPFPNQPLQAVIFAEKTNLFPNLDKLENKDVEVSGKISEYRKQPQIIITTTNQLKVVETTAP